MNLLQSFMGCMYPGAIRTESIESMEHDYPDFSLQVANIDMQGNEVSRGQLQLTDRDLIYYRPGKFPTRWPIGYIRRYGCSNDGNKFVFEAGRRCPTGEAIFAYRLSRASDLVERLREKIENLSKFEHPPTQQPSHLETKVPHSTRKDASTSTDDPRPLPGTWLSYALIDFDISKALSETKQHAANRVR